MDNSQVYRKARAAAIKQARAEWGQDNIKTVKLNMVTAWEDPQGYSRWDVVLDLEYVADHASNFATIEVNNGDFVATVVDRQSAKTVDEPKNDDSIEFRLMSVRTEVVRRYEVINAEPMDTAVGFYAPVSVKFTFVDGDLLHVQVYGFAILGNSRAYRVTEVPGVYSGDERNWPEWLVGLRKRVSVHGLAGV